jgi:hypothetical protein
MKGDFSRVSFEETKHYTEVLLQQGRVQLDADWNEAAAIEATRDARALRDLVGTSGSPNAGFQIAARVTLDAMDSRERWVAVPETGHLCVDYTDFLRGIASLHAHGVTAIRKSLAAPVDLSGATVSFAVKVGATPMGDAAYALTLFVTDGVDGAGTKASYPVTPAAYEQVGVWRVYTIVLAPPGAPPDFSHIRTIGFEGLQAGHVYHFDLLQRDFAPPAVPLKDVVSIDAAEDLTGWSVPAPGTGTIALDAGKLFNARPTVKIIGPGDGLKTFPQARDLRAYLRYVVITDSTTDPKFFLKPAGAANVQLTRTSSTTSAGWTTHVLHVPDGTPVSSIVGYGFGAIGAGSDLNVAQVLAVLDLSGNFFILGGTAAEPGRTYVNGTVCQKEVGETYYSQRDYPEALPLAPADGRVDLVYVDVWQRHVTYLEDPELREVALGGPDTCTRLQTIAQVKVLTGPVRVGPAATARLDSGAMPAALQAAFEALAAPGPGTLSTIVSPPSAPSNLCEIAPDTDYLGLDNRLYRVEIHDRGTAAPGGAATFKWSRMNGSLAAAVVQDVAPASGSTPQKVRLERLGRDSATAFVVGDLVEVCDDLTELSDSSYAGGVPVRRVGELRVISDRDPDASTITLDAALTRGYTVARHAKVRKWDGRGAARGFVNSTTTPQLDFGDGIKISFDSTAPMLSGDYWQFTARGITGEVEPLAKAAPAGLLHHYCPLALIRWKSIGDRFEIVDIADCRPHLPALTELQGVDVGYDDGCCGLTEDVQTLATWHGDVYEGTVDNVQQAIDALCARADQYLVLRYVSGDGQEGLPGETLPAALVVAVENSLGEPQADVEVTFAGSAGSLAPAAPRRTNANGEASVTWTLGTADGLQTVTATLNTPQAGTPTVKFNARVLCADKICFHDEHCRLAEDLHAIGHPDAAVDTVQEAIDALCEREGKFLTLRYVGGDGQEGLPGETLRAPLIVAVENVLGEPQADVEVTFAASAGSLAPPAPRKTNANGEAEVTWTLGLTDGLQTVTATLTTPQAGTPTVTFNARVLCADKICFRDTACGLQTDFSRLGHEGRVDTVQEALDTLCERDEKFLTLRYVSGDGQEGAPGAPLRAPIVVAVDNVLGRAQEGVIVDFTIVTGEPISTAGSVSEISVGTVSDRTAKVKTGSDGTARVIWTLGPELGLNLLKVSLDAEMASRAAGSGPEIIFNARGAVPAKTGSLCTIVVGDGVVSHGELDGAAQLQTAIDRLKTIGGGTLCILRGEYELAEPIVVSKCHNLVIHGNAFTTSIRSRHPDALAFEECVNVALHDLIVANSGDATPRVSISGVLRFKKCSGVTVENCVVVSQTNPCIMFEDGNEVGTLAEGVAGGAIRGCRLSGAGYGAIGGIIVRNTSDVEVAENEIRMAFGGGAGIDLDNNCDRCFVNGNHLTGFQHSLLPLPIPGSAGGIRIGSGCDDVTVSGNRISGGTEFGIGLGSVDERRQSRGGLSRLTIARNVIEGMSLSGIGVLGFHISPESDKQPITDDILIDANVVNGCAFGPAPEITQQVPGGTMVGNRIAGGIALWMGEHIRIVGNQIRGNGRLPDGEAPNPVSGVIIVYPGARLAITGNTIVDSFSSQPGSGFQDKSGGVSLVFSVADEVEVPAVTLSENDIDAAQGWTVVFESRGRSSVVLSANSLRGKSSTTHVMIKNENGSVGFTGNGVHSVPQEGQVYGAISLLGKNVTFANNHCLVDGTNPSDFHVDLRVFASAIATGNHCLEPQSRSGAAPSLRLTGLREVGNLVAVANVTTNGVRFVGGRLPVDIGNVAGTPA